MSSAKKITVGLLIILIGIQFMQPARNKSGQVLPTDISGAVTISDSVQVLLKRACYDCHSNNTNYIWYDNIQPARLLVEYHIKHGKHALNFSEFGAYSERKQHNKLKAIGNQIKDGTMPLKSYTLLHIGARLTKDERATIAAWADSATVLDKEPF